MDNKLTSFSALNHDDEEYALKGNVALPAGSERDRYARRERRGREGPFRPLRCHCGWININESTLKEFPSITI